MLTVVNGVVVMCKPVRIHGILIDDSVWEKFDRVLESLPSGLNVRIVGGELAPVMVIAVEEHPFFRFPKLSITPEGLPDLPGWQPGEKEAFERLCEKARKRGANKKTYHRQRDNGLE